MNKSVKELLEEGRADLKECVIHAYAEMRAMERLVDEVESLLDICRRLFGTSSWADGCSLESQDSLEAQDSWYGKVAGL